jgi:DNA-binding LacI/PurR family transcriptional regulator
MAKSLNMAEVARTMGVSASTVSRALRNDPRISPSVRERARLIAEEMGYRPNPLVSALMSTRRRRAGNGEVDVIALVTHYGGPQDWRAKDVCRWEFNGIQARADALGFRIEIFSLNAYRGNADRLAATLRTRGIRGVLLGFAREEEEIAFPMEGFAVAGLSAYFRNITVDRANFHGFFNVQLALDEIRRAGYRRPALAVPEFNNRLSNNLWSGAFLDWQRSVPKKDQCAPFIPSGDVDPACFYDWLYRNNPDALLVYKLPLRSLLAKKKIWVPQDIGLAYLYRTADEMGGAAGIDGNLSAVGAAALDLVVEKLNTNALGAGPLPKEVLIKGRWQSGDTLPLVK